MKRQLKNRINELINGDPQDVVTIKYLNPVSGNMEIIGTYPHNRKLEIECSDKNCADTYLKLRNIK